MERGETKENQTLTPRKFRIQTLNVKLGEFLEFVSSWELDFVQLV